MSDFDAARVASEVARRGLFNDSCLVEYRAETSSTNDDVMALADAGAPSGTTVVAGAQRCGRGRRGNVWFAPAGENLTFSVLLRLGVPARRSLLLPLLAGLGVAASIRRLVGDGVRIKWPNDVYVGERKVAGILVESKLRGQVVERAVVGIGVNVDTRSFPQELQNTATSLALEGAQGVDKEELLVDVLSELDARSHRVLRGEVSDQLAELERLDWLKGRRVRVGDVVGKGAGIASDGALLVAGELGVQRVISGTVELA